MPISYIREQYLLLKKRPNKEQLDLFFEIIVCRVEILEMSMQRTNLEIDKLTLTIEQAQKPVSCPQGDNGNGEKKEG